MTLTELKASNAELEETHQEAEQELKKLQESQQRGEELRERKRAVLEAYGTGMMAWGLTTFPPRLRRLVYDLLGLRVAVSREDPGGRDVFFHDTYGPYVTLECDFSANVIRYTREVEEYVEKMEEVEREWAASPTSEDYFEDLPEFVDRKLKEWSLQKETDSQEAGMGGPP